MGKERRGRWGMGKIRGWGMRREGDGELGERKVVNGERGGWGMRRNESGERGMRREMGNRE